MGFPKCALVILRGCEDIPSVLALFTREWIAYERNKSESKKQGVNRVKAN